MQARKKTLTSVCHKLEQPMGDMSLLYKRLFVDEEHNILLCHIPHVGDVTTRAVMDVLDQPQVGVLCIGYEYTM